MEIQKYSIDYKTVTTDNPDGEWVKSADVKTLEKSLSEELGTNSLLQTKIEILEKIRTEANEKLQNLKEEIWNSSIMIQHPNGDEFIIKKKTLNKIFESLTPTPTKEQTNV